MISILLASYNGEKYIAEQIESLLWQSVQDFRLFIRDDQSTDNTYSIIQKYASKYPERIFISRTKTNTGGAKHNFFGMMLDHKDEYVMLCDQDDVWFPDKVEKSLCKMRELEKEHGINTPLLVHTDLRVVDKDLNVISKSYEKMSSTSFRRNALRQLLTMNTAAGCTEMYNRSLAELIIDEPDFFVVHDWWLAMTASAFGNIGTVYEPTISYRQHGGNNIGAKKVLSFKYITYFLKNYEKVSQHIQNSFRQACSFLNVYESKLSSQQIGLLNAFSSIPGMSRLRRCRTVFKHRTLMNGFPRKVAQIMILLSKGRVQQ